MGYANSTDESPVTVTKLAQMKQSGEKFTVLTAYDATFSKLADQSGVAAILVGDSLGMVVQGHNTTIPTSTEEMAYHCKLVSRGCDRALLIADLPFLSYATPDLALKNAALLMQEGRAQVVKLEGGRQHLECIRLLTANGVPVCGHLGLLPQSVNKLGGYRVQGRQSEAADRIVEEALALEDAGADMLVAECIPAELGARLSATLSIPVIGIGAGPECDGQVLVLYDMLGITQGRTPKFAHNFLAQNESVLDAMKDFVSAVKSGRFPAAEHCF